MIPGRNVVYTEMRQFKYSSCERAKSIIPQNAPDALVKCFSFPAGAGSWNGYYRFIKIPDIFCKAAFLCFLKDLPNAFPIKDQKRTLRGLQRIEKLCFHSGTQRTC